MISVCLGSIVDQQDCDVLVSSSNMDMSAGLGVCGVIHRAAGPELEEYTSQYPQLELGDAFLSPGFALRQGAVIHVCGPSYRFDPDPAYYLALAVKNALTKADSAGFMRIAIPAISMGVFSYPPSEAVPIMVRVVVESKENFSSLIEVRFVVTSQLLMDLFSFEISKYSRS